jgi:hypothetical protein
MDSLRLKARSFTSYIRFVKNGNGRPTHIGPSEAETFWATFLKSMLRRGLRGVKLVISDAHDGLKAAIRRVVGALVATLSRPLDAQRAVLCARSAEA